MTPGWCETLKIDSHVRLKVFLQAYTSLGSFSHTVPAFFYFSKQRSSQKSHLRQGSHLTWQWTVEEEMWPLFQPALCGFFFSFLPERCCDVYFLSWSVSDLWVPVDIGYCNSTNKSLIYSTHGQLSYKRKLKCLPRHQDAFISREKCTWTSAVIAGENEIYYLLLHLFANVVAPKQICLPWLAAEWRSCVCALVPNCTSHLKQKC